MACLVTAICAMRYGEKNITTSDWASFITALVAIILWQVTDEPLYAAILVTLIDILGYYPSFRKSWSKPHEESVSMFALSILLCAMNAASVETYAMTPMLYPATATILNIVFVAYLFWCRRIIRGEKTMVS